MGHSDQRGGAMKQTMGVGNLKSQAQEVALLNRGGDLESLGRLADVVTSLCDHLAELSNRMQELDAHLKRIEEAVRKKH
jgi:hypothetical protein